jgi:ribosomal protein S3
MFVMQETYQKRHLSRSDMRTSDKQDKIAVSYYAARTKTTIGAPKAPINVIKRMAPKLR